MHKLPYKEVLVTMSGFLVKKAQVSIPLLGSDLDFDGIVAQPAIAEALTVGLHALCRAIQVRKTEM